MAKQLTIHRTEDIQSRISALRESAVATCQALSDLLQGSDALRALALMKFELVGHDPLDPSSRLNLTEQLNQTFTYLASFKGAEFIFKRHPKVKYLKLNLGTAPGSDIDTPEDGGVVAEVFAAVHPDNNRKLNSDIEKVRAAKKEIRHRYVLFISPAYPEGEQHRRSKNQVVVWSLGAEDLGLAGCPETPRRRDGHKGGRLRS